MVDFASCQLGVPVDCYILHKLPKIAREIPQQPIPSKKLSWTWSGGWADKGATSLRGHALSNSLFSFCILSSIKLLFTRTEWIFELSKLYWHPNMVTEGRFGCEMKKNSFTGKCQ